MTYDWSKMVKMTVPVGLCGWQQRGSLTINGRTTEFPVGVETELPEPVAERIKALIDDAEGKAEHVQTLKPWQQFVTGEDGVAHWSDRIDKPGSPHQYMTTDGNGKPHWEDKLAYAYTGTVDILTEETYEATEETGGMVVLMEPPLHMLIEGGTYEVNYNGASYNCVCYAKASEEYGTIYMLGNAGDAEEGMPVTDDPFVVGIYEEDVSVARGFWGMVVPLDGSTTITLSITGEVEKVKTIDPKYLPSGSGGGMLTVNVEAAVSEDGASLLITSHSHSAQEILEAVEAGMNAQAIVSTEDMGNMRMWLPLAAIVIYDGMNNNVIVFASPTGTINITFGEDEETWDLQIAL